MGLLLSSSRVPDEAINDTHSLNAENRDVVVARGDESSGSRLGFLANLTNRRRRLNHPNDLQSVTFASYFFMAGKRFKNLVSHTQSFLFGDNLDLNFILSHKPSIFPYQTPSTNMPTKYLQSLINIRKDTIKLVKCASTDANEAFRYSIEFRFDCDVDTQIRIHYFAIEKFTSNTSSNVHDDQQSSGQSRPQLVYQCGCSKYIPKVFNSANQLRCICLKGHAQDSTRPIVFKKGANILFQAIDHTITPAKFHFNAWQFNINTNYYPIVIECVPVSDELKHRHAHITLAYLDKSNCTAVVNHHTANETTSNTDPNASSNAASIDELSNSNNNLMHHQQSYLIKPIRQKQFIDGILFSLQEIYGIEKKSSDQNDLTSLQANESRSTQLERDEERDQELKGIECVICMCETRDTLILPCRHLCLCKLCAVNLRVQSNNCPICRIPFIALLQLKMLKRKATTTTRHANMSIVKFDAHELNAIKKYQRSRSSQDERTEHTAANPAVRASKMNSVQKLAKAATIDQYEAITIYEAFNGALLTQPDLTASTSATAGSIETATLYQTKETQTIQSKRPKKSKNKTHKGHHHNYHHQSATRSLASSRNSRTASLATPDENFNDESLDCVSTSHTANGASNSLQMDNMSNCVHRLSISSIDLKDGNTRNQISTSSGDSYELVTRKTSLSASCSDKNNNTNSNQNTPLTTLELHNSDISSTMI